jgi:hypothetical protein
MCGYAAQCTMLALVRIIRWRIRGATYVQMAQIAQRSAVFWAHAASEVRVVQMLIARELRHVLKNAQTLLDSFLSLRRQIAPSRQYFIFNVIALLRRHLLPDALAVAHILLLLRRQLPKALLILEHPLSLFGTEALLVISVGIVIVLPAA